MNKQLFKLDLKILKIPAILITPLCSLLIIGIWIFMYKTNKPIIIETFHVDYAYVVVKLLAPISLITSTYLGYFVNKKYYNSKINELIFTQNISKKTHYITHLVSLSTIILTIFFTTTLTLVIISIIFKVFSFKLIIIQLAYLLGMLFSAFFSHSITTLTSNESTTFYNWILPSMIFVHQTLAIIMSGLISKTFAIINKIFNYINFFGFIDVDIEAVKVNEIVSINFIHLLVMLIVISVITIASYFRFKNKEMI